MTGETVTTAYNRGLAHLIHYEIDHLDGMLCTARMWAGGGRSSWRSTGSLAGPGCTKAPERLAGHVGHVCLVVSPITKAGGRFK